MKTVFSNAQVRHVWATGTQDHGRSHNGNFSFQGDTLYSYRTPIARRVKPALKSSGVDFVYLISSESYSVTTASKHRSGLYRDTSGAGRKSFTVPMLGRRGGMRNEPQDIPADGDLKPVHVTNLAALTAQYGDWLARLHRQQSEPQDYQREWLLENAESACEYARLFKLKAPRFDVAGDLAELATFWAAKIARLVEAWRAGLPLPVAGGSYVLYDCPTMLRLKPGDPATIQTSRGAEFPVRHGVLAWRVVRGCHLTGVPWSRNGHSVHLGHFQIDQITAAGDVIAGCNTVPYAEVERMAREIGLTGEASNEPDNVGSATLADS